MRGENPGFLACKTYTCGTSPRARGKHLQVDDDYEGVEHPRVRGENKAFSEIIGPQNWNIPACAGKTQGPLNAS